MSQLGLKHYYTYVIMHGLVQAYYLGWHPPEYVWFTYSWYDDGWWEVGNGNSSCTPEILRKMVSNSLAITPNNNLVSDDRHMETISGLVS